MSQFLNNCDNLVNGINHRKILQKFLDFIYFFLFKIGIKSLKRKISMEWLLEAILALLSVTRYYAAYLTCVTCNLINYSLT